ncbi:helix-turn-helix domain-containing protein [Nocardia sp. NBC_01388]|uniref:helix-turn-helix domain-containing protein n=1 Tax=Nocardia sp. NBC_01388 TaxID=2903596 RepID=UPI0038707BD2
MRCFGLPIVQRHRLIRAASLPVTLIAERVGYISAAAFSRASKNRYGTPPARWRRDIMGR